MQNSYIIKNLNNKLISFYYGKNKSIYYSMLDNSNYTTTNLIIENVINYFTICLHNNEVYIFSKNIYGDVILCKSIGFNNNNNNLDFTTTFLFKDLNNLFYPIFLNNNLSLVYNNHSNNMLSIKSSKFNNNNFIWTNPENIDIINNNSLQDHNNNNNNNNLLTSLASLDLYKVHDTNFVLSYIKIKSNKELQTGFKIISNGALSDFIIFHKTGHQLVDYSIISFNNKIHIVYIIKNLFSTQVIYRNYNNSILSNPVLLFEGQKIKNCCICVINNKLYCKFIVGNILYYLQSDDYGNNFSSVVKYKRTISQDIEKFKFLDFNFSSNEMCRFNEIFVDSQNFLNLHFVMDFAPHIFKNSSLGGSSNSNFISNILNLDDNFNNNNTNNNNNIDFISNLSSNNLSSNNIPHVQHIAPKENTENTHSQYTENNQYNNNNYNNNYNNNNNNLNNSPSLGLQTKSIYTNSNETDFMSQFDMSKFESMLQNKKNTSSKNTSSIKNTSSNTPNINNSTSSSSILENRIKILEEQLKDKNNEVFQLNSLMQSRNKERTDLENSLRLQLDNYKSELDSLKSKDDNLNSKKLDNKNLDNTSTSTPTSTPTSNNKESQ